VTEARRRISAPPRLEPPSGLTAFELELRGERLAVLVLSPQEEVALPGLSDAERKVAELAVAGYSNREIASIRATSVRTIANQLARIFAKTGTSSRRELATRWVTGRKA
jgi:DNA-binding CsgD family transcriptional regulator